MRKKTSYLWLIIPFIHALSGCCHGDAEPNVYSSGLTFSVINKQTNQDLLGLYGIYHKDTVKIFDEDGVKVFNGSVAPNGQIYFKPIREDEDGQAFTKELTRKFYLYLNQFDTDTIKIEFKLKDIKVCPNKFGSYTYVGLDYAKIYFNDSLYTTKNSVNVLGYNAFLK